MSNNKPKTRIARIAKSNEEVLGSPIFLSSNDLKNLAVDTKSFDKIRYVVNEESEGLSVREER